MPDAPLSDSRGKNRRPRSAARGKFALTLVSTALTFVAVEFAFRVFMGIPAFSLANWRVDRVITDRLGERAEVDRVLGWTLRPHNVTDDHTTIEHGIRANFNESALRTGTILAVGDSFTEGWEVDNDETWPAYLERRMGAPVVNGGVGGYATDQIVLRAEQLLPIVKPKTLIVGILELDIFRSGHSHFGAPKPYFTLEGGELHYQPPAPLESRGEYGMLTTAGYKIRHVLGYSAAIDYLVSRLAPNYWYGKNLRTYYRRVDIDVVRVTCALLLRLKKRTDEDGIRMLLFMQHGAPLVLASDTPSANARGVVACAQAAGIEVIDQFASLRAIVAVDRNAIRDYYHSYEDNTFGHMTSQGNEHAAGLLAKALAQEPAR